MARYAGIGSGIVDGKAKRGGGRMRSNYGTGRGLSGKTRTQEYIDNNLGVISGEVLNKLYRDDDLDAYDRYLCNEQYDKLMDWDAGDKDTYIPIRKRRPRVIFNLPRRIVNTVATKLCGSDVFPKVNVEDDPDTEQFLMVLQKVTNVQYHLLGAVKKALGCGSSFLRFYAVGPTLRLEIYDSKYCYPNFDESGQLTMIEVRYVYEDAQDIDSRGTPKRKWYRLVLSAGVDILYDNPLYTPGGQPPIFEEVSRAEHGLGFVQGQWFRTDHSDTHGPDGESILCDVLDMCDALNYSLSQADQAVAYAQEPQLAVKGMDIDEVDDLVKSSQRAWNLGRDGEAAFVEAEMGGVEKGMELRDKFKQHICDVARICLLDPEKLVAAAQSAKAMEVMHGPLVELVDELRQAFEPQIMELLTKLMMLVLELEDRGENEIIAMPKGWSPAGSAITLVWPPIFAMTMADLLQKVQVGVQAANASLISRESTTRWLAKDFGIENVDEEIAKVAAQPQLNPFGSF